MRDAWIPWLAIALAAAATYSLRAGGLLLAGRLPQGRRFRRGLEALPGAIMLSIVIPGVLDEGLWGLAAAGACALVAWKTRSIFAAMLCSMLVILIRRHVFS